MRPKTLVLGLNAALLLSTAVIAADPAAPAPLVIEEEQPLFTLSIHGGVTAFGIPDTAPVGVTNDGDAGTLGDVDLFEGLDNPLYGGTIGIDMSAPINGDGTSINFSGFGSFVTRDGGQSRTLNEEQYLVVHGPNMPTGQIDLDTIDLDVDNVGTTTSDWGDATAGVNAGGGLATGTGTLLGPAYNVASNADGFVLSGAQGDYGTYAFGVIATTEGVVFLGSGERAARMLHLHRLLRLDVAPVQIGPPWGVTILDLPGRVPLPAKITIEVLPAIDLAAELGPAAGADAAYDLVTGRMQEVLDRLADERTLPVIG